MKQYEIRSGNFFISSGVCELCGDESVGTLDFGSEEKTFFCANCARVEYEETRAKIISADPNYSC